MNELWFIYSPRQEHWGNLRLATIGKPDNQPDIEIVIIHNETPERMGPRIWPDIVEREGWVKVSRIEVPTAEEVEAAMEKQA